MRNLMDLFNQGLVSLDSYSASASWVGFFESNNVLGHTEATKKAIHEMKDFLIDSDIVCSCHFFGELNKFQIDYDISQLDIENIIIPLLEKDLLRSYAHYSECEEIREIPLTDFCLKEKLCLAIMEIGVKGHLFFFNKKTGVIAYPHDDAGFGFIGTTVESEVVAKQFLEKVLKEKYWRGRCRQ